MLSPYDTYLLIASGVVLMMCAVAAFIHFTDFMAARQKRAQHRAGH